ncbi:MAG: glycosyltransferase family 4 protein [Thermodesulfobacteriota bacterium]|nr:glycosyltransferase family 4 protein [Thermodesulfobacteriota bacterium]
MGKKVKLAFFLFKYFPFGGLQRDFMQIAKVCLARGHQVDVYSSSWEGKIPDGLQVSIISASGFTNHRRCESFIKRVNESLSISNYDVVVGFNKMPGLDIYFAADTCFAAKALTRGFLYRLTPRYRSYLDLERAVFNRDSKTEVLLISENDKELFIQHYGTDEDRFHILPPGVEENRFVLYDKNDVFNELLSEFSVGLNQKIVLMIGSSFKTKGVDRAIRAISALPLNIRKETILMIVGEGKTRPFNRMASRLGVLDQVYFAGGREDIPKFLQAADLLLHTAYQETAGIVLIEAMAAGLPILVTDTCGYSSHVERAGAGEIISSPFKQDTLNEMLAFMLTSKRRNEWGKNGRDYINKIGVFNRWEKAADIIEEVAM